MTKIIFDLETVHDQREGALEAHRAEVRPPANYRKPESIAEWIRTEGEAAGEASWRKTALDPAAGEIISVALATEDSKIAVFTRAPGEPEAQLLEQFFAAVRELLDADARRDNGGNAWPAEAHFIGHNAPFDLGFLWKRSLILGIRPGFRLPSPNAREGRDYTCTMRLWAGPRDTIGLDRLCRALGIKSPKADGVDGSQVFDLWRAGEIGRIREYNAADVRATREVWSRLVGWGDSA